MVLIKLLLWIPASTQLLIVHATGKVKMDVSKPLLSSL
jgi:hypothetical protein